MRNLGLHHQHAPSLRLPHSIASPLAKKEAPHLQPQSHRASPSTSLLHRRPPSLPLLATTLACCTCIQHSQITREKLLREMVLNSWSYSLPTECRHGPAWLPTRPTVPSSGAGYHRGQDMVITENVSPGVAIPSLPFLLQHLIGNTNLRRGSAMSMMHARGQSCRSVVCRFRQWVANCNLL